MRMPVNSASTMLPAIHSYAKKLMLGAQYALQMLGIRVLIGQEDSTAEAAPLQAALACGPIRVCSKEASQSQPAALLVEELRGQISGSKPDDSWQALNKQVLLLFHRFPRV